LRQRSLLQEFLALGRTRLSHTHRSASRVITAHRPEQLCRTEGTQKRRHDSLQRLALSQTRTDEEGQAPQRLSLGRPTPESNTALKIQLELALKIVSEDRVMLGGTQQAAQFSPKLGA